MDLVDVECRLEQIALRRERKRAKKAAALSTSDTGEMAMFDATNQEMHRVPSTSLATVDTEMDLFVQFTTTTP